jgi:hypothetical protein
MNDQDEPLVEYPTYTVQSADNEWTVKAISAPMAAILAVHTYQPKKLASFLIVHREGGDDNNACVVDTRSIIELFGMKDAEDSLIEQN